ncbi:MAG: hypothetical protein ACOYK6_02000 [Chthoniobacterales bacterium]
MNSSTVVQRTNIDLADIFSDVLDDAQQIKADADEKLYSDSLKPPGGGLGGIRAYSVRSREDKALFHESNETLVKAIRTTFGSDAVERLQKSFALRLKSGTLMTVGSVRRFLRQDLLEDLSKRYPKDLVDSFKKNFATENFKIGTSEKIEDLYWSTQPGPDETVMMISGDIKSMQSLGFYIDDEFGFPNGLIDVGGLVRIQGEKPRALMAQKIVANIERKMEQGPEQAKNQIRSQIEGQAEGIRTLNVTRREKADALRTLQGVSSSDERENSYVVESDESISLSEEQQQALVKAANELKEIEGKIQDLTERSAELREDTHGYETWDSDRLSAYKLVGSIDWSRFKLKIGEHDFHVNVDNARPAENLKNFKTAVGALSNPTQEISDRQAAEILGLLTKENLSGGFPTGSDPDTGISFGIEPKNAESPLMHLTLQNGSYDFKYILPEAFVKSITIPGQFGGRERLKTLNCNMDRNGNKINLKTSNDHLKFDLNIEVTSSYTPPNLLPSPLNKRFKILDQRDMAIPTGSRSALTTHTTAESGEGMSTTGSSSPMTPWSLNERSPDFFDAN